MPDQSHPEQPSPEQSHPEQSNPVLAARIGRFTFHGDTRPVLAGIDLSLAPGTLTAVLGGSGSGKSTLGRLVAGWLAPGSNGSLEGFLELAGTRLEFRSAPSDPRIDPAAWCRQVGFVPQDAAALMSTVRATVAEELAFGLENLGTDLPAMQAAVRRVAALTGLEHLLERDPAGISGGELRRLAIGCAVITGPAVLILDEPFASLDAAGTVALTALLRSLLAGGTAVVVLSQAVDALLLAADHWMLLNSGTVALEGLPADLAGSPALEAAGVIGPSSDGSAPDSGADGHAFARHPFARHSAGTGCRARAGAPGRQLHLSAATAPETFSPQRCRRCPGSGPDSGPGPHQPRRACRRDRCRHRAERSR